MEEFIIREREAREKIVEIVRNSKLPAVTLKSIFKDFLNEANIAEQQEYQRAQIAILMRKKHKEGKEQNEKRRSNNSRPKG